jgi:hypothetical protein
VENEVLSDLDTEISALVEEEFAPTLQPPAAPAPEAPPAAAPVFSLPPEIMTQLGPLAALAQQYLGDNTAALKAITDKLAAPASASETPEEQKARAEGAFLEFLKDPEKAIAKIAKAPTADSSVNRDELMLPAFQAMGEKRADDFLRDMREDSEVRFDAASIKKIEKEFWNNTEGSGWATGSFSGYIGKLPKDQAGIIMRKLYAAAVGEKALGDLREGAKGGKVTNVAGGGGGSKGLTGVSADKLALAQATARGLATGEDGKLDKAEYAEYLKIQLGS